MSTRNFESADFNEKNGTATGLMKPGEAASVVIGPTTTEAWDGTVIPDVQSIQLDYASFPTSPLYKYTITLYRIKQDSTYYYYFKDESGDDYKLSSLAYSIKGGHEVSYNSDKPDIVEIRWEAG